MSYLLPHLTSGWQVDQAILSEEERVVIIRFGHGELFAHLLFSDGFGLSDVAKDDLGLVMSVSAIAFTRPKFGCHRPSVVSDLRLRLHRLVPPCSSVPRLCCMPICL